MSKYDVDNITVKDALKVPEIVKIIEKYYPGASRHPLLFMVKGKTLPQVLKMMRDADPEKIRHIRQEIGLL